MKIKKSLSILLALALVLGSFSGVFANPEESIKKLNDEGEADLFKGDSISADPRTQELKNDDQVRVIVEVEGEPVITYATAKGVKVNELDSSTVEDVTENLVDLQKEVKSNIKDENIGVEYHTNFHNVVNGFSATTTLGEAEMIERLPNVKRVVIATEYERPEPEMKNSHELINSRPTWDVGYDGEGTTVAIIDTGIDPSHKDMVLSNPNKAALNEDVVNALATANGLSGKWYTDKVPYGYNYADNNYEIRDLGPEASMHGMHVGGTAGANGDEDEGGIKGVAPESQLLAMKVFGNNPAFGSTYGDLYVRAIDDAIALGADVVNMSLGSTASYVDPNAPEQEAIKKAVENGIVCAVSAGNSNHIGDGFGSPLAKNPDIGVVGAPGLAVDSIQVASNDNLQFLYENTVNVEGLEDITGYGKDDWIDRGVNGELELIAIGGTKLGEPDDYEGIDVEGKVVLVSRGEHTFVDKTEWAAEQGAIGIIVYNNDPSGIFYKDQGGWTIPFMKIHNSEGLALEEKLKDGSIIINVEESEGDVDPASGQMSSFTSWGVTPNLDFKPEITAPGGNILSTLNDDEYGPMSGTSMAAPHVAGGSALVLQRVDEEFDLDGRERAEMAKNLMMSTANPVVDKGLYNDFYDLGNYTSPRRQGAGTMDLLKATSTPAIITEEKSGISKVNLREIDDETTFTLTVDNFDDQSVAYAVYGSIGTDLVIGGENYTEPQSIFNAPMTFELEDNTVIDNVYDLVEVPANDSIDFDVTIDLSNATDWANGKPLKEIFPNGNFVEGFVELVDVNDDNDDTDLSIPYLGFYGEWDEAPIIDDTNYEEDGDPFYGDLTVMTWLDDTTYEFLGYTPEGPDESKIAFSPNGDEKADTTRPIMTFLRNAKELDINILDSNKEKVRDLDYDENISKNYFDLGRGTQYHAYDSWTWDGMIDNDLAEDGQYYYEVKTRIDYAGANWQTVRFPVKVDTKAPVITEELDYNEEEEKLTVISTDKGVGIKEYRLKDSKSEETLLTSNDGVFDLTQIDLDSVEAFVEVVDYAENTTTSDSMILKDGTEPTINVDTPSFWGSYTDLTLPLKGSIEDSSEIVEVKVEGEAVEFEYNKDTGNYDFETILELEDDGYHKIDIMAIDKAGNEIGIQHKFWVDTQAPTINMTEQPSERIVDYTVENIDLSAEISDNFPDLTVKVNGNVVEVIEGNWAVWSETEPAEYTLEDYEVDLEYGDNIITVEAEDGHGNTTVNEYKVYRKQEGEEDPVLDVAPEIIEHGAGNDTDISSNRPVTIDAKADMEVDWKVEILDPNNEVVDTINQTGTEFNATWAPEANKKLNGEYTVRFTATNDGESVAETANFTVYNYQVKVNDVKVIDQDGYVAVEAEIQNLDAAAQNPMLVIQVKNSNNYVLNISTAQIEGLSQDQIMKLSSGFGLDEEGTYTVEAYVWTGWENTTSLSSPTTKTFTIE